MNETDFEWRAAPLVWGQGPRLFEVFLEPTCPHSAKAFGQLDATLHEVGAHKITLRIWLHSQPWHLFSGVIVRCVLAASTLPEGKEGAKRVLEIVAANRGEFEPADHCSGILIDTTPAQVIAKVEKYAGLRIAKAFGLPKLDYEMKRHARYARQNGIHFSRHS